MPEEHRVSVRFGEGPQIDTYGINMVVVAEWIRHKIVALVYAGSNPVDHPKN